MRASGFSLWLVPEGAWQARLARLIETLARRLGTPAFEPHVTLLGGAPGEEAQALAASAGLARALAPLELRLTSLDALDEYFRCVFVHVAESRELLAAHAAARVAFGAAEPAAFLPHLSLVYGDLSPAAKAPALREAEGAVGMRLLVRRLELVRTQGTPAEWRRLAGWGLAG